MRPDDNVEQVRRSWWHELVASLSQEFQTHDIWYVPHYAGPGIWCSKPKGTRTATINVTSTEELRKAIKDELAAGR